VREYLRNLSVGRKLVLIQLTTAGVLALLLVASVSAGQTAAIEENRLVELASVAGVIGYNSIAPLDFMDEDAGREVLASLKAETHVVQAAVYNADGKVAFTYRRDARVPFEFPKAATVGEQLEDAHMVVVRPIQRPAAGADGKREQVGLVYLRASMADVDATIKSLLLVMAMILALGLVVALVLSMLLSRAVLRPVRSLVTTMDRVGATADYSLRVQDEGDDEFGRLAREFNQMLELVGARDSELEDRVLHRTLELTQSEKRLGQIIASTLEGIMVFDGQGHIVLANPAVEQIFSVDPGRMLGRDVISFIADTDLDHGRLRRTLRSRQGETLNFTGVRDDGSLTDIETQTSTYNLGGEEFFVAAVRDISERRRLERMKSEFVATVSHELRTPLTSVIGAVKLLLGGAAGELQAKQLELLEMAARNGDRLITLVNELLDIQRIEAGKLSLDLADVDVARVIGSVVSETRGMAVQYGIALDFAANVERPVIVRGDETRLAQILANLVSNAIKHSSDGDRVELALDEDRESGLATIRVIDHGEGIAKHHQRRIFGKFQQVDSSDSRAKGGTGLGLAIVAALVEAHQGRVGVDSELGLGSTFWVQLPLARNGQGEPSSDDTTLGKAVEHGQGDPLGGQGA